jgi:hypothetical protein
MLQMHENKRSNTTSNRFEYDEEKTNTALLSSNVPVACGNKLSSCLQQQAKPD